MTWDWVSITLGYGNGSQWKYSHTVVQQWGLEPKSHIKNKCLDNCCYRKFEFWPTTLVPHLWLILLKRRTDWRTDTIYRTEIPVQSWGTLMVNRIGCVPHHWSSHQSYYLDSECSLYHVTVTVKGLVFVTSCRKVMMSCSVVPSVTLCFLSERGRNCLTSLVDSNFKRKTNDS